MNILFITASRIGDAVLSTGLLDYIAREYPDAKVTIACGPLCAPLFAGYPALERVIPLRKRKYNAHWIGLFLRARRRRWDMIVDLRNSAVSRLLKAEKKFIYGKHIDKALHKAEQNAEVMKLAEVPAPRLWFTAEQAEFAAGIIQKSEGDAVLAVAPAANWPAKTWPAERFIETVTWMRSASGPMPRARVAVFAAAGEEEEARRVLDAVPEAARIDVIAKGDPGEAAAALSGCDFFIGNDSGLMHCAAAAGVKTLGLFGPSWPHLYRPWGAQADYVSTPENFDALISYEGYNPDTAPCLMESLSVEAVKGKIREFF